MVLALDCGHAVNPDQIAAQVEGSVAYGLTAALYGECTVENGRMVELNFDTYRILRLAEMPKVETVIVPTYDFWGGVGEPTICVVTPGGAQRDLCGDRQAGAQPAAEEREAGVGRRRQAMASRAGTRDRALRRADPQVPRPPARAEEVLPGGSSRGTAYFAPYPFFAGARRRPLRLRRRRQPLPRLHAERDQPDRRATGIRSWSRRSASRRARARRSARPTEAQVRVAKLLCDRIPSLETIRFTNSGTEGTLMAIRAAWAFTGKHKLAKFEGGYHGAHEHVAVSVQAAGGPRSIPPGRRRSRSTRASPRASRRDVIVLPYNDLAACERMLRAHKDEVGRLIMEPIVSSFGYVPGDPGVPPRHPQADRGAQHRPRSTTRCRASASRPAAPRSSSA